MIALLFSCWCAIGGWLMLDSLPEWMIRMFLAGAAFISVSSLFDRWVLEGRFWPPYGIWR